MFRGFVRLHQFQALRGLPSMSQRVTRSSARLSKLTPQVAPGARAESTMASGVAHLNVGDRLPAITLQNENGDDVEIANLAADNGIIVFMYPRANTPGCTRQARGFAEEFSGIEASGYQVYGLSTDKPKSQLNWKNKHALPFSLLCDPDYELIGAFGARKQPKGIRRSHVVVEKGGVIKEIKLNMKPEQSVELAVSTVKNASNS